MPPPWNMLGARAIVTMSIDCRMAWSRKSAAGKAPRRREASRVSATERCGGCGCRLWEEEPGTVG